LQNAVAPQGHDFQTLTANFPQPLRQMVINYWKSGTPLPYNAQSELDFQAKSMNMTTNQLLQLIGASLK